MAYPATPKTRADYRTALTKHTYGKLTDNTTLDYYINVAELEAIGKTLQYFPGAQQSTQLSGSTDSNGILLMPQGFQSIKRMEDANKNKFELIANIDDVWKKTGYYFAGFDTTNNQQKICVMKAAVPLASTTMYYWITQLVAMGTATSAISCIPDPWCNYIDYLAAFKFWEDQGPSMKNESSWWESKAAARFEELAKALDDVSKDPEWIPTYDVDAGEIGGTFVHIAQ